LGYKDRVPILEWAKFDDEVRARIRKNGPAELKPSESMQDIARTLVAAGITNQAEVERAIGS
jgi:type II secretory ATPase GspE/PulE/Tfp pilus assembly ATPase PilB-like protein